MAVAILGMAKRARSLLNPYANLLMAAVVLLGFACILPHVQWSPTYSH